MSTQPGTELASDQQLPGPQVADSVLQSLRLAVLVFDTGLRTTYRNHAAFALFPDRDNVATMLQDCVLESGYESWTRELRRCMEARRPARFEQVSLRRGDLPPLLVNISCTPLIDAATGRTVGGTLVAEDVTASTSMATRLAASERLAAVGKLAARVAHELNNPLDGILRYINLAARVLGNDGPAADRYLEEARRGLRRMVRIVGQLLEFSRNAHAPVEEGNVNKVIDEAIRSMDEKARAAAVTVVCNFDETAPCQPVGNLFQVFCNLIKNAIDAMPNGGVLTVTTRAHDRRLLITFEDTGVGLPADAEHIFEPFFTTKPSGKGTGLGLAISREIVERCNGIITAERRAAGGSVFAITLPLQPPPKSPAQPSTVDAETEG